MKKNNYNFVKKNVLKQINSKEYAPFLTTERKTDKFHFFEVVQIATLLWKNEVKTKVPEALKIAALCHDIDRIYPQREVNTKNCPKEQYTYMKMIHACNSALIFFEENPNLPRGLVHDICFLIIRHEHGGDRNNQSELCNKADELTGSYNLNLAAEYLFYSDKLSFFYSGIYEYKNRGEEKLRNKIQFSLEGLPQKVIRCVLNLEFKDKSVENCVKGVIFNLLTERRNKK